MSQRFCPKCGHTVDFSARFCGTCGTNFLSGLTGQLPPEFLLDDRYIIIELVGQGGMGAVYKATDTRIQGRLCAVKEMGTMTLPASERAQAMLNFQQEAQMLAQLRHPNLPQVHDYFEDDGRHYLVMGFIEGDSLESILLQQGHPFPEEHVRLWGQQLCSVLDYLHQQNPPVIFRDLSPKNVMVDSHTGDLKLIDFGIARLFKHGRTQDTQNFGTPGYAPPEQYGQAQTDARSDLYSLGVTLLRLVTMYDPGIDPFNLPPARQVNPAISPQLEAIIQRAIRPRPEERFQTAREFLYALQGTGPIETAVSPPQSSISPPWKIIGGVVILFLIAAVGGYFILNSGGFEQPTPTPNSVLADVTLIEITATTEITDTPSPDPADEPEDEPGTDPIIPPDEPTDKATPTATVTILPSPTSTETLIPSPTPTPEPTLTLTPDRSPETFVIGYSVRNQPIEVVRVGDGPNGVLFVGGMHQGYAPGSVSVAQQAADYFSNNLDEIPEETTAYFLLSLNPDSPYAIDELAGRLNANGVDLNRNWDCNWSRNTKILGQTVSGGGGSTPFSEPEVESLHDFIVGEKIKAAVFWGAQGSIVSPGSCGQRSSVSGNLAQTFGIASGYRVFDFESSAGEINGDATNWLDSQRVPAITVLLPDHTSSDWQANLAGIRAVIREYGR